MISDQQIKQKSQGSTLKDNIFTNIMIKIHISMEGDISPLMQNCFLNKEDGDKGYDTSLDIHIQISVTKHVQ